MHQQLVDVDQLPTRGRQIPRQQLLFSTDDAPAFEPSGVEEGDATHHRRAREEAPHARSRELHAAREWAATHELAHRVEPSLGFDDDAGGDKVHVAMPVQQFGRPRE